MRQLTTPLTTKVHHCVFGEIATDLIKPEALENLEGRGHAIFGFAFKDTSVPIKSSPEAFKMIDEFRQAIGATYLYLNYALDEDIEQVNKATGSFTKSFKASFDRGLRPNKYHKICGMLSQGYGGAVTQLANIPFQEELALRWRQTDWNTYMHSFWITKNLLHDKEVEYRNASIAVLQIGIGVCGMWLGVVGLVIGIAGTAFGVISLYH